MKKFSFGLICFLINTYCIAGASPVGLWTTIDDNTHEQRAIVKISEENQQFNATIIKVFPKPGDTGTCRFCPGKFKNKPINGLQFAWGFKASGPNTWDGGQILDPKSGKIYKAKMTLEKNKLLVRGYVGIPLLGRTQVWERRE